MFYEIAIQNLLREVDKLESTIRDLHKQNNELHEINCQLSKENSDMVTLLKSTTQSIKDLQRTLYINCRSY
jgi:predicted  nucleic acid-binding Zn-ribbon protein